MSDVPSMDDVDGLRMVELKEQLSDRGLSAAGKKKELVDRLKEALKEEASSKAAASGGGGGGKRRAPATEDEEDSDSSDSDMGPMPVAGPPKAKKKKRTLDFEKTYLDRMPSADMYEKSYMHRDNVTHVVVTPRSDFVVTASVDGHLKFWKIMPGGIEFVKHFKAHLGPVAGMDASADGARLCTTSEDRTVKFYDVLNFDMNNIFQLDYDPCVCVWAFSPVGGQPPLVCVSDNGSGAVRVYNADGEGTALATVSAHRAPVKAMAFNLAHGCVVSLDAKGMVEYWAPSDGAFPAADLKFTRKIDTDLYDLAKSKAVPAAVAISPDGALMAVTASDKQVRVFHFATGKLRRKFDESLGVFEAAVGNGSLKLEQMDFMRRSAVEAELADTVGGSDVLEGYGKFCGAPPSNPVFDASSNFLFVPTLAGVKVINLVTNRVEKVLGMVESGERFLGIALYQGVPHLDSQQALKLSKQSKNLLMCEQSLVDKSAIPVDPMLFCLAFKRNRFYVFSRREPAEGAEGAEGVARGAETRDVFNEKPSADDMAKVALESVDQMLGRQATIHTTAGDVTIKLFPDECPRTVENFCGHARNGYYNNVLFHRVIKGFMLQTGDPAGDGTGGESIWGGEFEDEFHRNLKHDRPFTVSMANAGADTNGSQFFVTTVPTPWLDNKHTVFGRVIRGMDVAHEIENVKCDKLDKPYEDVRIVNVTVA